MIKLLPFILLINANLFSENKIIKLHNLPPSVSERWWSNSFFGSVHKKIAEKAFELINGNEYPDLLYFKKNLIKGCLDEDGHPNIEHNGGDVYSIWFSSKVIYEENTNNDYLKVGKDEVSIRRIISVLNHYNKMDFETSYENIGVIAHLTQDQAVPVHAANIKHMYFDQFERFYEDDYNIDLSGFNEKNIPDNLKPWEYYQWVQDDTRKRLAQWIDPETKIPYWVASKDAPPLGQDSTYGPYGSYGGGKDHFGKAVCETDYNAQENCKMVPKSPEIRKRQIAAAVFATAKLFKSASKELPPLIKEIEKNSDNLSFKILENRCSKVSYKIYDRLNLIEESTVELKKDSFPYYLKIKTKIKSNGYHKIEVTDCDANTSTEEIED